MVRLECPILPFASDPGRKALSKPLKWGSGKDRKNFELDRTCPGARESFMSGGTKERATASGAAARSFVISAFCGASAVVDHEVIDASIGVSPVCCANNFMINWVSAFRDIAGGDVGGRARIRFRC